MLISSNFCIMTNIAEWRRCLVTYRVWNGKIHWDILWPIWDQSLEWLNLMLAQRTFLAGIVWAKRQEDVNILSSTDLFESWDSELAYKHDALDKHNYYK